MAKIHAKSTSPKLKSQNTENQGCSSDQHPFFSFRYMTTNKQYSLGYLTSISGAERESTFKLLYDRLEALSCQSWLHWTQQPKQIGLETIKYDQLKFEPRQGANLARDTTLYVFRFDTYKGTGKGRIIGFKGAPCSVLHIIGYDFDFSAYNHG